MSAPTNGVGLRFAKVDFTHSHLRRVCVRSEVHWRNFLSSLKQRGLEGITLITSDAHEGLKKARQAVFHGVAWQRCQFHLQQNAMAYVPKKDMRKTVASDIRDVFNAKSLDKAEERLEESIGKYQETVPKLAKWMDENIREGFSVFALLVEPTSRQESAAALDGARLGATYC